MAAAAALKDVDDKYKYKCSVCLGNFKEPKLLPCLHRFCEECFENIIEKHDDGEFKCPLCNKLCDIPPEGVDGFPTDFHMKSMLEYIQLKQTAKTADLTAKCGGCSKESRITSYCFKCKGYLCEQCSSIHLTLKMMKEHTGRILSLKEIREQKLTMERLATLTETPRCQSHVDKPAEVCCGTCQNIPVCMMCAQFGKHKAHDIQDVGVVAEKERSKIGTTMETLEECRDNMNELLVRVEKVKKKLSRDIRAKKKKLKSQHIKISEKIGMRLKNSEEMLKRNNKEIDDLERNEVAELEEKRKNKIESIVKIINDKFDGLIGERRAKNQDLRKRQETLHDERVGRINKGITLVDRAYKELESSIDQQGATHKEELKKISNEAANRKMRYDNFSSTTSSILASKDNWTEAHCLPDISKAGDSLVRESQKACPELQPLGKVKAGDLNTTVGGIVRITAEPESVVDIESVKDKGWEVFRMRSTEGGSIVITGEVDNKHTYITVMDRESKITCTDQINQGERDDGEFYPTCSPFTLFELVTSCVDGQLGIYNTQTKSHNRKHMSDIFFMWDIFGPKQVLGVTSDPINKTVYIGNNSSDVFVLIDDIDMLNYSHTLKLPQDIQMPYDMVIHDDNLIVCDILTEKACIVTREGPEAKLVCELSKPDHIGDKCAPYRVCTDCNGFIYILWESRISGQIRDILTQYSPDGLHLLATKELEFYVTGIDTVLTDGSEKLLLVTTKGRLYTYGLDMGT